MARRIKENFNQDGIDRRGFLECMAWAGTGLIWTVSGGVLSSKAFGQMPHYPMGEGAGFTFVQISDSHIGFNKEANKDVTVTLQEAINKINALEHTPDFLIHTGDLSHLSKPTEFDTLDQVLRSAKSGQTFFVPGEHDMLADNGQQYLERYGKGTKGAGWYSFDHKGVHFIGLVNVVDLKAGGLGTLGAEQLAWLEKDLAGRSSSTPIVVFAHIPLWTVYPDWGWGTGDGAQALSYLKRFGSATVLNGHIHQTMQKVEGNVFYHTAMSTAFPQPKPGTATSPGPMKVPAEQLREVLGITHVNYIAGHHTLAVVDSTLAMTSASHASLDKVADTTAVKIDNFSFAPQSLTVKAGAAVTWTNRDDIPHNVVSTEKKFSSPVLDTDQTFSFRFGEPGSYPYFCKIHPTMTGMIVVEKNASGMA
ncbi:MAG: metallophosphoesterase [Acidobacteriaceae bacterium]|nr:metallophosphoesterase [Acidobacteriaceae bacterium]MBV9037237.1 metallophosphoesterase [Acidobacteriaceae bacterium]MBV9306746.1 metallophosphoesterase [Acidobacteriaceae bacterium]MBV9677326.1 metallophosphoesterase [Acidobacteriaceae bacterium]MBV9937920.1 metallophosphoesterase [Acidobacteriaceae bacterium]